MLKPIHPQAYELLHEGTLALADMEAQGIRVNVKYIHKQLARLKEKISQNEVDMRLTDAYKLWHKWKGTSLNLDSRTQLSHVMYKLMGYEPVKFTNDNEDTASTDAEAFQDIDDEFIKMYIDRAHDIKLIQVLNSILREEIDGHIHSSFGLNVAISYRGNCSDPNVQNWPIRNPYMGETIRRCAIPEDNHVIVEIDYSQLEVRIAACYNKDKKLIEYVNNPDKCMHYDSAAELFCCKREQVSKELRHIAKNQFVFPEFYGSYFVQCAPAMWGSVNRLNLTIDDMPVSKWLKKQGIRGLGEVDYHQTNKGRIESKQGTFYDHVREVEDKFWNVRFKEYAAWKKRFYRQYQEECGFNYYTGFRATGYFKRRDVTNYPIQGSAFHCLLWSIIQINKRIRKLKMRSRIINQIHDSIIATVHRKELRQYVEMATSVMTEDVMKHWKWIVVPLKTEVEACEEGQSWFDKKHYEIGA